MPYLRANTMPNDMQADSTVNLQKWRTNNDNKGSNNTHLFYGSGHGNISVVKNSSHIDSVSKAKLAPLKERARQLRAQR